MYLTYIWNHMSLYFTIARFWDCGRKHFISTCGTVRFTSTFWDNEFYVNVMGQNIFWSYIGLHSDEIWFLGHFYDKIPSNLYQVCQLASSLKICYFSTRLQSFLGVQVMVFHLGENAQIIFGYWLPKNCANYS